MIILSFLIIYQITYTYKWKTKVNIHRQTLCQSRRFNTKRIFKCFPVRSTTNSLYRKRHSDYANQFVLENVKDASIRIVTQSIYLSSPTMTEPLRPLAVAVVSSAELAVAVVEKFFQISCGKS